MRFILPLIENPVLMFPHGSLAKVPPYASNVIGFATPRMVKSPFSFQLSSPTFSKLSPSNPTFWEVFAIKIQAQPSGHLFARSQYQPIFHRLKRNIRIIKVIAFRFKCCTKTFKVSGNVGNY